MKSIKLLLPVSVMGLLLSLCVTASGPDPLYADENLLVSTSADVAEMPTLSAQTAILMDEQGTVLYEKNADTRVSPASTTKIMTALTVLKQNADLDTLVTIPREAVGVEGSSVYLYEGEELSLGNLLYAMLLESANDAAAAIAIHVGTSVADFAVMMNECAAELGLSDTHFENPHGLDSENHYTTARSLATMTRAAFAYPAFREMVSTYKTEIPLKGREGVRLLVNHNRLLKSLDGCIGVKTGFTKKSGRCLVSAVERDGLTLFAVTCNAPDDWKDHAAMYDYGFSAVEKITLSEIGEQYAVIPAVGGMPVSASDNASGDVVTVAVRNETPLAVIVPRGHAEIEKTVRLPRFVYAPVTAGDVLGTVVYTSGDRILGELPLYATESVTLYEKPSLLERFFAMFK